MFLTKLKKLFLYFNDTDVKPASWNKWEFLIQNDIKHSDKIIQFSLGPTY